MAIDTNLAIQTKIYEALTGDATLMSDVGNRIYDEIPSGLGADNYPRIEIGDMDSDENNTKTTNGWDVEVEIHVWSKYDGNKEIQQIMRQIHDLLHRQEATVGPLTDHDLILIEEVSRVTVKDLEPDMRHSVQRFRVIADES